MSEEKPKSKRFDVIIDPVREEAPDVLEELVRFVDPNRAHELVDTDGVVDTGLPEEDAKRMRTRLEDNAAPVDLTPVPESDGRDTYRVTGNLWIDRKVPVEDVVVKAYDRGLRDKRFLSNTRTDGTGGYEIACTADRLPEGRTRSHLLVRVFNDAEWGLDATTDGDRIVY